MPFVFVFKQKQAKKNPSHQILLLYRMDTEMTKHILFCICCSLESSDICGYIYTSKISCLGPGLDYCANSIDKM